MLKERGYNFQIMASDVEEDIVGKKYDRKLLVNCAQDKAVNVAKKVYSHDIIVSADTIVVFDDIIIGKPKDKADAFDILRKLSGGTHFVETCVFILKINSTSVAEDKKQNYNSYLYGVDRTYVTFRDLSDNAINDYIEISKPFDKAGAYGIQDDNFNFIKNMEGHRDNVIGFPMELFERLLQEIV